MSIFKRSPRPELPPPSQLPSANRIQVEQHQVRKVIFSEEEFMRLLGLEGERTFFVSTAGRNVEVYLSSRQAPG